MMWQCSGHMPGLSALNLMYSQPHAGTVAVSRRLGLHRQLVGTQRLKACPLHVLAYTVCHPVDGHARG